MKLKFLGFSLYWSKEGVRIRVHEKPLKRLAERLKALTSRKRSGIMEGILRELTVLLQGWLGYYSIADIKTYLKRISEWMRRWIRQIYWKRWKRVRTRSVNLTRLGVDLEQAFQWANTRKGYWRTAGSGILSTTITNHYLEAKGFPNLVKRYEELRARAQRLTRLHATH
ncbi:MAG: hypothetical protein LBB98_03840 [Treponema sp.]|nr:hypothetical protein [Treponema sp.]